MPGIKERNLLKNIARKVNDEIRAERKARPEESPDSISRRIMNREMPMVKLMGFMPSHLYFEIGVLNGKFKER